MPWRGPEFDGEFPSLGWGVLDWAERYFRVPDGPLAGEPLTLTDEQARILVRFYQLDDRGRFTYRRAAVRRAKGWGKALALDTPIPTPTGWATIGSLAVRDQVFDERGQPCTVRAVSPVWPDADCWQVVFSDDETIVASGDHLWAVEDLNHSYRPAVSSTRDLAVAPYRRGDGARRYRLQMPAPLCMPDRALPIDPYTLGVWLGDGEASAARITVPDEEIMGYVGSAGFDVVRTDGIRWRVGGLQRLLRAEGLLGNKHIPPEYLRASLRQRLALLQGLMDTDGHCEPDVHRSEFTTATAALAAGTTELLSTLGVKYTCREGRAKLEGRDCGPKWRIGFTVHDDMPVFRLRRKAEHLRPATEIRALHRTRRIVSITPVPTVPTRCIEVDSPSSLFLVGRKMVQTHNSPLLAVVALAELCGPSRFERWDDNGDAVGTRPVAPWVQVAAVSEDQTDNTYSALYEMASGSELAGTLLDVGLTRVFLNDGTGRLEPVTAAAGSREGQRVTFAVLDETHLWYRRNGGQKLAATIRRNAGKMNGRTFESTNAHVPGEDSVAEHTAKAAEAGHAGLLYDSVEAPQVDDLSDRKAVAAALKAAYGDARWVDLERLAAEIADPSTDPDDARRFYFNQATTSSKRIVDIRFWETDRARPSRLLEPGTRIGLGFDGSISDDSTVLYAATSDLHVVELAVWERPHGAPAGWTVPRLEVHDAVWEAFEVYDVGLMLCDPPLWRTEIEGWAERYRTVDENGKDVERVVMLDTNQARRFAPACDRFATGVRQRAVTHDGNPTLTLHLAASVKKFVRISDDEDDGRSKFVIVKEDVRKIDAAVGAILAVEAAATMPQAVLKPTPAWGGDAAAKASKVDPSVFRPKQRLKV